jgi:RNA polymerase sigma factor (sigma-70 family)
LLEKANYIQEQILIDACKKGNSLAFTQLYSNYSKEVFNSITRLVSNNVEAEDLLQESFIAAYQNIKQFDKHTNFKAWIKRIAINKSITFLRKKKIVFNEWNDKIDALDEKIDETAFSFQVEAIKSAIQQLPYTYKTIVQLYVLDEIPQEEIGQMLGLSHNTVRIQYHRAKQKILQLLQNEKVV